MNTRGATEPNNPLTRMLNQLGAHNAARGAPAGRDYAGVTAEPLPNVRSAAMTAPPPLPPDEEARRNQLARELGVMPGDDALEPSEGLPTIEQMTAREFITRQPAEFIGRRQMPDFSRVEMIDLRNGTLLVDNVEFPIAEDDVQMIKAWAVQKLLEAMTARIAEAASQLGLTLTHEGIRPAEGTREEATRSPEAMGDSAPAS